jgi:beta-glucosidase
MRIIVVIMVGAPYDLNEIKKSNHAVVWSWFNGPASEIPIN